MKGPKRVKDWVGNYVKALRPIRNGLGEMPAGTIYRVSASSGMTVWFEALPCKCCGFKFHFSQQGRNKFNGMEFLGNELPAPVAQQDRAQDS